jgi:hypothetical protein
VGNVVSASAKVMQGPRPPRGPPPPRPVDPITLRAMTGAPDEYPPSPEPGASPEERRSILAKRLQYHRGAHFRQQFAVNQGGVTWDQIPGANKARPHLGWSVTTTISTSPKPTPKSEPVHDPLPETTVTTSIEEIGQEAEPLHDLEAGQEADYQASEADLYFKEEQEEEAAKLEKKEETDDEEEDEEDATTAPPVRPPLEPPPITAFIHSAAMATTPKTPASSPPPTQSSSSPSSNTLRERLSSIQTIPSRSTTPLRGKEPPPAVLPARPAQSPEEREQQRAKQRAYVQKVISKLKDPMKPFPDRRR